METRRVKYEHSDYIERLPYVAVRKSRMIDCCLFQQLIKDVPFDLYPKETMSLEIEIDRCGRVVKGPVMWTMHTGHDSKYGKSQRRRLG